MRETTTEEKLAFLEKYRHLDPTLDMTLTALQAAGTLELAAEQHEQEALAKLKEAEEHLALAAKLDAESQSLNRWSRWQCAFLWLLIIGWPLFMFLRFR